jgi:hypothetical protein
LSRDNEALRHERSLFLLLAVRRQTSGPCVPSARFPCFCGWLSGGLLCYLWRHMQSSRGDCPWEGRARVVPCLESGSMPGRWHARGRTEHASLQGAATYILVAPWLAQLGVHRPRRRARSLPSSYMGLADLLFLWLFLSSPSACVSCEAWPELYCFVFTAVLLTCCVY